MKKYIKPVLTEHGSLKEITNGAGVKDPDAGQPLNPDFSG